MNWYKVVFFAMIFVGYSIGSAYFFMDRQDDKTEQAMKQMVDHKAAHAARERHFLESYGYAFGWLVVLAIGAAMFCGNIKRLVLKAIDKAYGKTGVVATVLLAMLCLGGCRRPFEPVVLKLVKPNEEAFLIPYTGDDKKQEHSRNEAYLKERLIHAKQIKIPQQWVPKGYETWGPNGKWEDAAVLILVDKSPVTREWTADPTTGTGSKNEAIWIMSSNQVEFSTGWTCTARIESEDDAVKFLHNYPNGSLQQTLDTEVRSKLQAEFGLEVTDLPMEKLQKDATPHIRKVTKSVSDFFKARGIAITNLGITGGFVYKDKKILDTMVRMFVAEQDKQIATNEFESQKERNKKVISEADGKAQAILKVKTAEADGTKMLAEAKMYELQKAKDNTDFYMQLKKLEIQKLLLEKWDGILPRYMIGGGNGVGGGPGMLLQMPAIEDKKGK